HAEQDGDLLDEAAGEAAQQQHDDEGAGGERQVGGRAEVAGRRVGSLRPAERDGQQGGAYQGDGGAGDDGREEADGLAEEGRREEAEESGDDHGSEDDRQGVVLVVGGGDDRGHRGDAGEGHAVDEGQPGADPPDAEGLQEGGEARREQAGPGEEGEVGAGQADGRADDQGRGDDARVHGGHVLQAGRRHLQRGQLLVDGVVGHCGSPPVGYTAAVGAAAGVKEVVRGVRSLRAGRGHLPLGSRPSGRAGGLAGWRGGTGDGGGGGGGREGAGGRGARPARGAAGRAGGGAGGLGGRKGGRRRRWEVAGGGGGRLRGPRVCARPGDGRRGPAGPRSPAGSRPSRPETSG